MAISNYNSENNKLIHKETVGILLQINQGRDVKISKQELSKNIVLILHKMLMIHIYNLL